MAKRSQTFRKQRTANAPDKDASSSIWRSVGELIRTEAYDKALTQLNGLCTKPLDSTAQGTVLSYLADISLLSGDFGQAATTYQKSSTYLQNTGSWLRPMVGQVTSLLKCSQVSDAISLANLVVDQANALWKTYNQSLTQAQQTATKGQPVTIPIRPITPGVVSSRMGSLFFSEGETASAASMWQQAITLEPQGVPKARIGLAQLALRQNQFADAMQLSGDALKLNRAHAHSLSAWETNIASRIGQGLAAVDPDLEAILQQAPGSVRARANLLVARTLRSHHDPSWLDWANQWLSSDDAQKYPVVAAEFSKMLLATAKLNSNDPSGQSSAASAVLQTLNISPSEMLTAGKELVRASCFMGQPISAQTLITQAVTQFGEGVRGIFTHSLALSYMMGKRHELARPLLQNNISSLQVTTPEWSKSVWALARMESLLGNLQVALSLWQTAYSQPTVPIRFRVQAQLQWLKMLVAQGNNLQVAAVQAQIAATIPLIQDYEVLLDLARLLALAPGGKSVSSMAAIRGETLATAAFSAATQPAQAITILFKLTRRRVNDFGECKAALQQWSDLQSSGKITWLWSDNKPFWNYIALIGEVLEVDNQPAAVDNLALQYLNDPATSISGAMIVGMSYAERLRERGNWDAAMTLFSSLAAKAPSNPLAAQAYYWMALQALKSQDALTAKQYASRIQQALGTGVDLNTRNPYLASALLINANLDPQAVSAQAVNFTPATLATVLSKLEADINSIVK